MSDQEQHPSPASPGPDPGATPPAGTQGAPPPPPPPATPSGGSPPAAAPLPWENRSQIGAGAGLVQSAQLFISRPREAFDRAARKGDYASPLLWAVLIGVVMGIVNWLYGMMFLAPMMAMMPPEISAGMAPLLTAGVMGGGIVNLVSHPIFVVIGTFIWAAIAHVCLLLVAGGGKSGAGFEGTFRAGAYSQVAQIAGIIPIVGGLITVIWNVVLLVIGMASLHRISTGQAVLVVLIPLILGCACIAAGLAGMVGLMGMVD